MADNMADNADSMTDNEAQNAQSAPQPAARRLADLYGLWRFCGQRACFRARACRRDMRRCLPSLALVPPEARAFIDGYEQGLRDGLSFEEMVARHAQAWDAANEWYARVHGTLPCRPEPSRGCGH